MKFRRIASAVTAAACCSGLITVAPEMIDRTYAAEVVYNSFETDYEGWYPVSDMSELTAVKGQGYDNTRGMKLTGRTSPSDGVASSKGFYLEGGVDYDYNIKVFSETDETFHVSLLYTDYDTNESTEVELITEDVKGGEWTNLSENFKAPENSYEFKITITTDSTNDFSFDEVLITEQRSANVAYAAPSGKGLKDEFANYFRVGNILNRGTVNNSTIKARLLLDHNAIECENEAKPSDTMVQNGSTDTNIKVSLSNAASIIDFCIKNHLAFRGHTLVWHSQTPEWFFHTGFNTNNGYVNASTMNQRMESYIKNMFNAYATQYPSLNLYAYDVCNEVVYDGTARNGGARPTSGNDRSSWVAVYGGNSFVETAFKYARQYAPKTCKLFYNDYNEFSGDKQNCIINTILSPLKQKGLIDGMGMQSHMDCSASNAWGCTVDYLNAMDKYLALGIEVQVTELDLSTSAGKYSLQDQATKYKAIFQHCVDVNSSGKYPGRVTLVQVWGPDDNNSWVGTDRNTGKSNAPLLYDKSNPAQPKLAYNAITSIIPDSQWGDGSKVNGEFVIKPIEPDSNGYYFHHKFEGSTEDWETRFCEEILTSGRTAYAGSEALLVKGRTAGWNGAKYPISSNPFEPGKEFSFSANVMYLDGNNETDTFMMKLQYTGADNETYYDEIASGTAPKGEWLQLANKNYKIPEGATDMAIYIETASNDSDEYNNFYIDEVIGAVAGTEIKGAGQPVVRTLMLGDLDFDGAITGFDLVLQRRGVIKGSFADDLTKKAADVDKSGKVEINDVVLLQQYLLRKITEFPVAEKVIDTGAMENLFKTISVNSSWKKDGENNPLSTQRYGADPGWMVYKDRLYIYTTNDAHETYSDGRLQINTYNSGTINCVSTADMVNWTDHGAIPVADRNGRTSNGAAKWAGAAWAPDACWKTINGKDKFFLYFANSGGGIGVLTADSPTGPWTDPLGKAMIDWSTPGCSGVVWMFDPGVYYDPTTDEAYIAWGGGVDNKDKANPKTGRIAKLSSNMTSIEGTAVTMETPYLFEDSSLIKIGDTWYYSYCTNWNVPWNNSTNGVSFGSGEICYMTSKNPLGPWTSSQLAGKVLPGTGAVDNGGNNHHSIIYFKNKYYVAYHTRQKAIRMGLTFIDGAHPNDRSKDSKDGNYRSTHINEASFNPSTGKITCNIDMKGCSQIESLNPYTKVQAETMSNQSKNISVNGLMDTTVHGSKGEWTKVSGVNFNNGSDQITIRASAKNGAAVKICTGSPTGDVIGYAEIEAGSNMQEVTVPVNTVSGTKDVYFVFSNDIDFDWWQVK